MSELFGMSPKWTDFHCSIMACPQCCLGLDGFWKVRIDNIFLRILDNVRMGGNQNDLNLIQSMPFEFEESVWRVRVARLLRAYHEPECKAMMLLISEGMVVRREEAEAGEGIETVQTTEPTTVTAATRGTARESVGHFGHVIEVFSGTSVYKWSDQWDVEKDA